MYRWWTNGFKTILNDLRCALTIYRGKIFEFRILSDLRVAQNALSQAKNIYSLAASVICITENVCPRFRPQEFGLDVPVVD